MSGECMCVSGECMCEWGVCVCEWGVCVCVCVGGEHVCEWGVYSRHQKKVYISRPYNGTGNPVPFPLRSRLISVRLPFSNRSRFVQRAARPFW